MSEPIAQAKHPNDPLALKRPETNKEPAKDIVAEDNARDCSCDDCNTNPPCVFYGSTWLV